MSEIEMFPRAVLAHHYPGTKLHGDFTTIKAGQYGPIDVLVGGTPCQSFSVAGLRNGLADSRGILALEYLRLADRLRPKWLVWENVPGVRSNNYGRDFGSILGGLGELGYGWAYRSFDAQYFGLAQRRERVFVVGYLGDWRYPAAVLFEPQSMRGDSPPRRKAWESVAGTFSSRSSAGGGLGTDFECAGGLVDVATTIRSRDGSKGVDSDCTDTLIAYGGNNRSGPIDIAAGLNGHGGPHGRLDFTVETFVVGPTAFDCKAGGNTGYAIGDIPGSLRGEGHGGGHAAIAVGFQSSQSGVRSADTHATLDANNGSRRHNGVQHGSAVRRLTPRECERLMGFPDDYTLIPYRGKLAKDGPRYKALGNSFAVPVMRWIGKRIAMVDAM
jgi:DNA (cytosine-5)-methyltransferase 1